MTRESGYTLAELLVSTAIIVTVTGAIFGLMNPAQGSTQAQPEVADMQQRMRVGTDVLFKELVMAGAGPYQGNVTGSLNQYFASILPRRVGSVAADPVTGSGSFTTDRITLSYVPNSYSQTTIEKAMPPQSAELKVTNPTNCPPNDLCGFTEGMQVIIFDTSGTGNYDTFVITNVQDNAGHLQHRGQDLNYSYDAGSTITQVHSNTYWLDTATKQLKQYDGWQTDTPLVDNVTALQFDYYGDPNPPKQPKPPTGVANCLFTNTGVSTMATLAPTDGSLVALTAGMLTDGPYCGSGDTTFDADLLRIRKVRVTLTMQVGNATFRPNFSKPGSGGGGTRYVPDYKVSFEVAPRNLNLTR